MFSVCSLLNSWNSGIWRINYVPHSLEPFLGQSGLEGEMPSLGPYALGLKHLELWSPVVCKVFTVVKEIIADGASPVSNRLRPSPEVIREGAKIEPFAWPPCPLLPFL
jgi:hypothetical protein